MTPGDFVAECRNRQVTPHVAQNEGRRGGSAIDGRTTRQAGYAVSQRKRKGSEENRDFRSHFRRGFLFLVWPCVITPSVSSTVGFFVFGDLGFVLQGHSNLVQTEQQAGAGERINRKLGGKTVRGRNCAALQIDGQLESTGLGTRHKVTNLCRRESH